MSRIVFVLGAGASQSAGAPLMRDFIAAAQEARRSSRLLTPDDASCFDLVFKARGALQAVHSKSNLNLNDVEALFGAFEMARLIGRLGPLSSPEIEKLPGAMARVIARTIETRLRFPVAKQRSFESRAVIRPPEPYEAFARVLCDLQERSGNEVAVITFNYDLAIDYALLFVRQRHSYCLEAQEADGIDLLKLHGSLNWGHCDKCGRIVPWKLEDYFKDHFWRDVTDLTHVYFQISTNLSEHTHCDVPLTGDPVIVPPTWNKGRYHLELANVWRRAALHLSDAEEIYVIGYSFPPTDEFFRYFYALGSVGESILTRVCVLNNTAAAADNFRKILGPAAAEPGCFDGKTELFERSIDWLRSSLGLPKVAAVGA